MNLLPRTSLVNNGFDNRVSLISQQVFEIKATSSTPYVLLDKKRNLLILKGRSSPERAQRFYAQINNALSIFLRHGTPQLVVLFKLEYFNTSSAKCIFDLFNILKSAQLQSSNAKIRINWYYDSYDEDMLECGKDYNEVIDLNFNYISIG